MTDDKTNDAHEAAQAAAHEGVAELLERVADRIGQHAGAKAVFGEPVEREGLTIIPVAQMVIGSGAGGGPGADGASGAGVGGGALTRPLGFIEIGDDFAAFRPIQQPWQNGTFIVSVAFGVLLLAKALRTLRHG